MARFIDRLNQELETFGKKAQNALDEGKLQLERFRLLRERDEAARKLGFLIHRRERGRTIDAAEVESWMQRMDQHDADIARVERDLATKRGDAVVVSDAPPPASAETGEAEVVKS